MKSRLVVSALGLFCLVVGAFITYLAFTFIGWESDISQWAAEVRMIYLVVSGIATVLVASFVGFLLEL